MRKPTQKEQVLSMLTAAGSWGLRSDVFLTHRIPRAAARINELRQDGYEISSEHEKQFVRYVLLGEPPRADAGSGAGALPQQAGSRTRASVASGESPPSPAEGEPPASLFELPPLRSPSAFRDSEAA